MYSVNVCVCVNNVIDIYKNKEWECSPTAQFYGQSGASEVEALQEAYRQIGVFIGDSADHLQDISSRSDNSHPLPAPEYSRETFKATFCTESGDSCHIFESVDYDVSHLLSLYLVANHGERYCSCGFCVWATWIWTFYSAWQLCLQFLLLSCIIMEQIYSFLLGLNVQ